MMGLSGGRYKESYAIGDLLYFIILAQITLALYTLTKELIQPHKIEILVLLG